MRRQYHYRRATEHALRFNRQWELHLPITGLTGHERRMISWGWWPVPNAQCETIAWVHQVTGAKITNELSELYIGKKYKGRQMTPPPF